METIFIAALVIAAAAVGYLFAVINGKSINQSVPAGYIDEQQPEQRLLTQYKNFLNYDGTGKGQTDIEGKD